MQLPSSHLLEPTNRLERLSIARLSLYRPCRSQGRRFCRVAPATSTDRAVAVLKIGRSICPPKSGLHMGSAPFGRIWIPVVDAAPRCEKRQGPAFRAPFCRHGATTLHPNLLGGCPCSWIISSIAYATFSSSKWAGDGQKMPNSS